MKQVGAFSIDEGVLSGPSKYMAEQGYEKLERILRGEDVVANASLIHSPDVVTGVLVAMQTDYAGWLGSRELARVLR